MNFELTFEQLQKKLKKVLNPSRFRFVVILYPNTNMIDEIKEHISSIYPDSSTTSLDLKDKSYQEIAPELYKNNEGFVYINDFDEILNNPDLYNGFNQRRDKIASFNINLICFISVYQKDELFTKAINVIPDLWEFKNTVLELEKDIDTDKLSDIKISESTSYSSIGGLNTKDKKIELEKLLNKVNNTNSDELRLNLLYQIATIYKDIGDFQNSLNYRREELKLKEILKVLPKEIATSYNNISLLYKEIGDLQKALTYQKKALEMQEEILEEKHPDLAASYNNISQIYQDIGDLQKALTYQKKDLEILKEILDIKHPDLATSYNNISLIYQDIGDLKKALKYHKKALEILEEILEEKHPILASSYNNLASIYQNMGEFIKALTYQKKALKIQEEILGDNHPVLAISYNNIAIIYLDLKDIKNSKINIDKAVNIFKDNFPDGHSNLDVSLKIQSQINHIIKKGKR